MSFALAIIGIMVFVFGATLMPIQGILYLIVGAQVAIWLPVDYQIATAMMVMGTGIMVVRTTI